MQLRDSGSKRAGGLRGRAFKGWGLWKQCPVSCYESSVKREQDVNPYSFLGSEVPSWCLLGNWGHSLWSNSMLPTLTEPLWCEGSMLIWETKLLHYLTVGRGITRGPRTEQTGLDSCMQPPPNPAWISMFGFIWTMVMVRWRGTLTPDPPWMLSVGLGTKIKILFYIPFIDKSPGRFGTCD